MDMKQTMVHTVTAAELDVSGYMDPCELISKLTLAATLRNKEEGGSRGVLLEKLNAAWMFRRIKLSQHLPIGEGDELTGFASGRTDCGSFYALRGEFYKGGRLAAAMDMIMMPVLLRGRKRLGCADIEPFYSTKPLNEVPEFHRLPIVEPFEYTETKTITKDDCDDNASHFAFHNYARLVCKDTGYWEGPPKLISDMQIDYVRECVTGSVIRIGVQEKDGEFTVQGVHPKGSPCFNARCSYSEI